MKKSRVRLGQLTLMAASIQLIFADAPPVYANPTGPQVINGTATFQRPDSTTLSVTNSPGTIINWQGFSIGAGELTRFIQQSPASAVLNRVVGADISQIHGQLLSNGRVFLINPSGIVIGPGAMIDTAGFVASTLNMLDGDFLAGKLKFQGDSTSGSIINQGWIRTGYGGHVLLVAPQIENSGLIHAPGGQILLAAGKKLTVTSLDLDGVQFEVQAPTDSVLNVGKLLADGGAVGVFAGSLRHSGEIRANALVYDEAGRIVLKAQDEIQVAAGSTTSADGKIGGDITIQSGGLTRVAGNVSAQGSVGQGGDIQLLGDRVAVVESASVNASGAAGGGQILVGGDFQGGNAAIQNASDTFVGANATLRADAAQSGDGGRIIVWSDDKAQFYGSLSARGGEDGGNGGFAEVSGKQNLIFAGRADLGAPNGSLGNLLLDPLDLYVFSGGGLLPSIIDESTDFPSNAATVSPATLAGITGNVSLFASRYMRISDAITLTTAGQSLTARVGTYTAPLSPDPLTLSTGIVNELEIGANITTQGGDVSLIAPRIESIAASTITTNGGAIFLDTSGATISASNLSLNSGGGLVSGTSSSSITLGTITTTGGDVDLTATNGSISTGTIMAGGGTVTLDGRFGVTGGAVIDTSGSVTLTASSGTISRTVNNAASLTATAGGSVFITSGTDLNVATVTAGSTASLTSTGGAILPASAASQVKGFDVTLTSTDTGSGGGIGAGTSLNVDVQRQLNFTTNAGFNVFLNGSGPNRLSATLNPAHATTGSYSGSIVKEGGGFSLNASADTTTVTLSDLTITSGFDQFSSNISVSTSGDLVANSVTVPAGNNVFANQLPVTLSASGDLTVGTYTQAAGLANQTTFSAGGMVSLGNVNAGNDTVTVTGPGGITVSSLMSTGDITLTSSAGAVNAAADNVGVEITSGGTLKITGRGIGTAATFGNPLDLAAPKIELTSTGGAAGPIGGASPVIASTQDLTIDAGNGSTFKVSTGSNDIKNLKITANPTAVAGGLAQVISNGALYNFNNDVVNTLFTFDLNSGTIPANHFANGKLDFTSTSGNIELGGTNLGTGDLTLTADAGSITTLLGSSITARSVTLDASTTISTATFTIPGAITATVGGIDLSAPTVTVGALNAPGTIKISDATTVSVGDIGSVSAPQTVDISGSTVTTGSVAGTGDITIAANSGLLTVGSAVTTTGSDKTIELTSSSGTTPFSFSGIDAGTTGTVKITSPQGIRQLNGIGNGIKAKTIELIANSGDIVGLDANSQPSESVAFVSGTNNLGLTVDAGGIARLDANTNTVSSLTVTKRTGPAPDSFQLADMGGSQSVVLGGSASDLEVAVSSPSSALNVTLDYRAGNITLVGGGISTGGGDVTLTASTGIDASAGITTTGGDVTIQADGGSVTTGAINTSGSGGAITINTFDPAGHIVIGGNLTTGTAGAAITIKANDGGNVTRSANFTLTSDNSVTVATTNGEIGTALFPLQITSPNVTLNASRTGVGTEGDVRAALTGTSTLSLSADRFFDVSSTADFTTLSVATRGTFGGTMTLTAPNQIFSFTRPLTDLFGPVADTFEVGSVTGPQLTSATFQALDGDLLVRGGTTLNATNLTLLASSTGNIKLQGNGATPLVLNNTNQTFGSTDSTRDLLITGVVSLNATGSQSLSAGRDIIVQAQGGQISIGAADQTISTSGAGSRIRFLGGAGAGEKVMVSATNSQLISADTSFNSPDMLLLRGGDGDGASVTLSYSGSGDQRLQIQDGIVTIEGGGPNSFAKIESTSPNGQQQICRNDINNNCTGSAGTLNILGGSGDGAFAQMTASGSQFIRVSSATNVKAGSGNGANVLLQAGTTQTAQLGNLTVQGRGGAGATATAQILAGSTQTLSGGAMSLLSGAGVNSFAMIATPGDQFLNYGSLNLSASGGGSGSFVEIQAGGTQQRLTGFGAFTMTAGSAPNTDAIIDGNSQTITGGALTLTGGTGTSGSSSDAVIRNLAGNQTVQNTSSITLNGGMDFSTTGILNLGTGTQTIRSSGALSLVSNAASTANAPVQVANSGATRQTVNVQRVDVQTSGAGDATLSSAGDQYIHTDNSTINPSVRVAALGSGTASIQASGSQLLEVDYPQLMQFTRNGLLSVGDENAVGNSLIQATDQSVFAGSILAQGGAGAGSLSKLSATNTQTISTLRGGIQVFGGIGTDSLATIDPLIQIILANGSVVLVGGPGLGTNADASIISSGPQTIFASNGDISLTGGLAIGSDAIISNLAAQVGCSVLSFSCGQPQLLVASGGILRDDPLGFALILGHISSNPAGIAALLSGNATQQTLENMEELEHAFDTLAPQTEDPLFGRRAPICR